MSGSRNGVAAKLALEEKCALYTHCYGHALNLAVSITMKKSKVCCDAMEVSGGSSRVRLGSSEPPFYTQPHPKLLALYPHLAALLPLVVSSVINLLRTMLFSPSLPLGRSTRRLRREARAVRLVGKSTQLLRFH